MPLPSLLSQAWDPTFLFGSSFLYFLLLSGDGQLVDYHINCCLHSVLALPDTWSVFLFASTESSFSFDIFKFIIVGIYSVVCACGPVCKMIAPHSVISADLKLSLVPEFWDQSYVIPSLWAYIQKLKGTTTICFMFQLTIVEFFIIIKRNKKQLVWFVSGISGEKFDVANTFPVQICKVFC